MIAILSTSLRTASNSRLMAQYAHQVLTQEGHPTRLIDLREYPLPLCDGGAAYQHPNVAKLQEELTQADAVIVAVPIYNYDINAALKNVIELTGGAWENKVVGFLCAAGGLSSYMSVMSLANDLMLDFRSIIVPRFVYATGEAFGTDKLEDPMIIERVGELTRETARLSRLLKAAA